MKSRKSNMLHKIVLILLVLWFSLSIGRFAINILNLIREDFYWISLNDTEKKEKLYRDAFLVSNYIDRHTKDDEKIIILTKDKYYFFLPRYLLYPKRVYSISSLEDIKEKKYKNNKILVVYPAELYGEINRSNLKLRTTALIHADEKNKIIKIFEII